MFHIIQSFALENGEWQFIILEPRLTLMGLLVITLFCSSVGNRSFIFEYRKNQ